MMVVGSPEGAVLVDTTDMAIEQVVERIVAIAEGQDHRT